MVLQCVMGDGQNKIFDLNQPGKVVTDSKITISSPLDELSQILGPNETLYFVQQPKPGFSCKAPKVVIEIQNDQDHALILIVPNTDDPLSKKSDLRGHANFVDNFGNILMASKMDVASMTVTSGPVVLGIIDGSSSWTFPVNVKNTEGQPFLEVSTGTVDGYQVHTIVHTPSGAEVGKMKKMDTEFILHFGRNLDKQMKGIIVVTAYLIYIKHHADRGGESCSLKRIFYVGLATAAAFIVLLAFMYVTSFFI